MTNYPFQSINDFNDIEVKNAYKARVLTGQIPEATFIADLRTTSRDNSRTPMQWDGSPQGGFTAGPKAWLAVNPNYKEINADTQISDPDSIYSYTKQAIALRHAHQAFVYGDYQDIDPVNPAIFAYTRKLGAESFLVVLNFSEAENVYQIPGSLEAGALVLGNLSTSEHDTNTLHLSGWEARVYKLK
jgi:oligo-1,6-glucosidase